VQVVFLWSATHYCFEFFCEISCVIKPTGRRYADSADTVPCPAVCAGETFLGAEFANQPEFTATASNIGYSWWSHDIGGHMRGIHDYALYIRWLQFGVFSPINRLHSTQGRFIYKAPWHYPAEIARIAGAWLPDGDWFDWFTGLHYKGLGGRRMDVFRPLDRWWSF